MIHNHDRYQLDVHNKFHLGSDDDIFSYRRLNEILAESSKFYSINKDSSMFLITEPGLTGDTIYRIDLFKSQLSMSPRHILMDLYRDSSSVPKFVTEMVKSLDGVVLYNKNSVSSTDDLVARATSKEGFLYRRIGEGGGAGV